jgi:hypothetical protein
VALLLAIGAFVGCWFGSLCVDGLLVDAGVADVWFEGDCPRVFDNLTDPHSVHARSAVHPLLALLVYPPVAALRAAGSEPLVAARLVRAVIAGVCLALLYGLLRGGGWRRLDAALFSLLGACSAGAMFWFAVPETYPFGLLSMLLALALLTREGPRWRLPVWDVAALLLTFAFTITNVLAGLVVTACRWPWRRAVGIVLIAGGMGMMLLAWQQQVFPSTVVVPFSWEETEYVLHADAGGPGRVLVAFLSHSMVMPALGTVPRYEKGARAVLSVQHSWPGTGTPFGAVAIALWVVLLGLGIWGAVTTRECRRLRVALGIVLGGQLVLHLLYGLETFTYAAHYGPLLVVLAAWSVRTRWRRAALVLAAGLLVSAAVNNVWQFARACSYVRQRAAKVVNAEGPLAVYSPSAEAPAEVPHAARYASAVRQMKTATGQRHERISRPMVTSVAEHCAQSEKKTMIDSATGSVMTGRLVPSQRMSRRACCNEAESASSSLPRFVIVPNVATTTSRAGKEASAATPTRQSQPRGAMTGSIPWPSRPR